MDVVAEDLIKRYIDTNLYLSPCFLRKEWFEERSYARWASYEILCLVSERVTYRIPSDATTTYEEDVFDVLDGFIFKMEQYLTIKHTQPFQVALDTAKGIRRYLARSGYYGIR